MRFLFVFLLTAIASYFALLIMPWWISMLIAFFVVLLLPMKKGRSFLAAALGVGLCWLLVALVADFRNDHLLSTKMAALFGLPSYALMIALSPLTGFITGGLGGWTAAALRDIFREKQVTTVSTPTA